MNITDMEAAYIAGFFDGEGSICISPNQTAQRAKNPSHTLTVNIANTNPCVLKWIQDKFGGGLYYRLRSQKNHRNIAQWNQRAIGAMTFLKRIRPFLRMKHKQADIAITFQESKIMKGPSLVSKKTLAWRFRQMKLIRKLNDKSWQKKQMR